MRRNLVTMLDEIRLAEALGIASCDELFGSAHHLASHMSALAFPVFVNGRNYTGSNITRDPVFLALIRQVLVAQLIQAAQALIVPLGNAAADAIGLLIDEGVIDPARCLLGIPHPSGANGHRLAQFQSAPVGAWRRQSRDGTTESAKQSAEWIVRVGTRAALHPG